MIRRDNWKHFGNMREVYRVSWCTRKLNTIIINRFSSNMNKCREFYSFDGYLIPSLSLLVPAVKILWKILLPATKPIIKYWLIVKNCLLAGGWTWLFSKGLFRVAMYLQFATITQWLSLKLIFIFHWSWKLVRSNLMIFNFFD